MWKSQGHLDPVWQYGWTCEMSRCKSWKCGKCWYFQPMPGQQAQCKVPLFQLDLPILDSVLLRLLSRLLESFRAGHPELFDGTWKWRFKNWSCWQKTPDFFILVRGATGADTVKIVRWPELFDGTWKWRFKNWSCWQKTPDFFILVRGAGADTVKIVRSREGAWGLEKKKHFPTCIAGSHPGRHVVGRRIGVQTQILQVQIRIVPRVIRHGLLWKSNISVKTLWSSG